jgi:hypothetical protein
VLTDKGRQTYDEAGRLQAPWANRLSEDLAIKDIDTTHRVVAELRRRLELMANGLRHDLVKGCLSRVDGSREAAIGLKRAGYRRSANQEGGDF